MGTVQSRLLQSGEAFRSKVSPAEVRQIALSRNLFHVVAVVPACFYYFSKFGCDCPPKFPATISFTIRAGFPKWIHHAVWSLGWLAMYRLFEKHGDSVIHVFGMQMFLTGVWTTAVCALEQSRMLDHGHSLGALLYMLNHYLLSRLLGVKTSFMRSFSIGFAMMIISMFIARKKYRWVERASAPRLPFEQQKNLFKLELAVMTGENLMFSSFVSGMCSGFPHAPASAASWSSLLESLTPRGPGSTAIFLFFLFSAWKSWVFFRKREEDNAE